MKDDRSLLLQLGRELRDAARAGAALAVLGVAASCAGKDVTATAPPDNGPAPTPPTGNATTPTDAGTAPSKTYALEQLGCFGPSYDGGYYGQCCFDVRCYTPRPGATCVASGDSAIYSVIPFPPGSGECGCSVPEAGHDNVMGPFSHNPADAPQDGTCCYLVGSIACTGRPFIVDGVPLIAPLALRSDWLLARGPRESPTARG